MASGHDVNKPRTEVTHQTRRQVPRERFPRDYAVAPDQSVGRGGFRGDSWNLYQGPVEPLSGHFPGLDPRHARVLNESGEVGFRGQGKQHVPDQIYVPGGHIKKGGERVGQDPRDTGMVHGPDQPSTRKGKKSTSVRRYPPEPYNWESRGQG